MRKPARKKSQYRKLDALCRVVIPENIRSIYGLDAKSEVGFRETPDGVLIYSVEALTHCPLCGSERQSA